MPLHNSRRHSALSRVLLGRNSRLAHSDSNLRPARLGSSLRLEVLDNNPHLVVLGNDLHLVVLARRCLVRINQRRTDLERLQDR